MRVVLAWLARRATVLLAAGVFAGLALPDLAALLRPLLTPSVWGLLVLALLRVDWAALRHHGRRPLMVGAAAVWLLVASPALMAVAVAVFQPAPGLAAALVLMAAAPPIVSSPAIAMIIGLDGALALMAMTAATIAAPLVLPVTTLALLGLSLDVGIGALTASLAAFIGSAVAVAGLARWRVGPARLTAATSGLDVAAVALLLVFAIAIMDGVAARLAGDPVWVLSVAGASFAANLALQAASAAAFWPLGRRRALTLGFLGGNRNMALMLAVLPAGVHPDVFLYFALGQIPIYVLPAALMPLYRWLLRGDRAPDEAIG